MKKTKSILLFAFLISTYITLTGFTTEAKADTYSMPDAQEWTIAMSDPIESTISYKVTSSSATAVKGTVSTTTTETGACQILEDQDLTTQFYSREKITTISAVGTLKNVTYASKTVEAWVIGSGLLSGITAVEVMNSTGIILNVSSTAGSWLLTSWEYTACIPGIPGYELPVLLTLAGISILGIIFHIRKNKIEL